MKKYVKLIVFFAFIPAVCAQNFTRKDSLQGGMRPERSSFDVQRYDLNITIDPETRGIRGYNDITFKLLDGSERIQIDLFETMSVDSIVMNSTKLTYKREFGAVFIDLPKNITSTTDHYIRFYYSGKPDEALNAPWDGGFVWRKDKNDKHWIGVAVQGTGASLWYPVKDTQTDEPDRGASIKVAVPNGLMNVSNGRFLGSEDLKNGYTRWDWEVKNPINTYDITVNIGDYVHIHDTHNGLDLDYYVLRDNEQKAKVHFEEVKPMMDCFQSKFGTYPFADDGFKLVETPYLGMEHQSAVAYGNQYKKGYLGGDISGTGIGLLFDYITIHETGHEWFGNSITSEDIADMWIHEGFTTYSETVFVECRYGYDKAMRYINGQKNNIDNAAPMIGHFGVNAKQTGDIYYKGSLLLNTLRHVIADDEKWWAMILKFSQTFRHKIINTQTVISFFNNESGINLTPVFDQYLRTVKIPHLNLSKEKNILKYSWENVNPDFNMPVEVEIGGDKVRLFPTVKVKELKLENPSADIIPRTGQFLITAKKSR